MAPSDVYKAVFDTSSLGICLLTSELIILDVNEAYLQSTARKREQLIGVYLFSAFRPNPDDPADTGIDAVRASILRAVESRKMDTIALQRFPILITPEHGEPYYEERYWSAMNTPIHDETGKLVCIVHATLDVTELVSNRQSSNDLAEHESKLARLEANLAARAQSVQELNKALSEERDRLLHLFDRSPGFVYFTKGPDHIIEQANEAFYALVGSRDLIGKGLREAFADVPPQGFCDLHDTVFATGRPYVNHSIPIMLPRGEGGVLEQRYMDLVYQPITDRSGKIVGICGQGQDITEAKRIQDELRRHDERWKLALEASGDGVWDWDLESDQIYYPHSYAVLLGYQDDKTIISFEEFMRLIHPEDLDQVLSRVDLHLAGIDKTYSCEFRIQIQNGAWIWVLGRGAVVSRDEAGNATRMVGTITDITESKKTEQKIWYEANFDNLTDLPNRRLFRDRLDQQIKNADRFDSCLALLFIDLDRFKEINDLLGHDAGDQLLVEAARRIQRCVRATDTVARLGGDEFTVILTNFDKKLHVEEICHKLLDSLTSKFILGKEEAYISASIGVTIYPPDADNSEALIRNADQAMYNAKKLGRNRFSTFSKEMQDEAYARIRMTGELRDALSQHQFQVMYQPIVELTTGRTTKAEALLRWFHPTMGIVSPSDFIPLAEESGLINEIGDWVFKKAASASLEFSRKTGTTFEISVNRSAVQFLNTSNDFSWAEYLREMGMPKNSISVEITEGMLVDATNKVVETLLEYRDAGIQVAIDDFGTGYSSMAYLKEFDIDYLKIDRSFIHDIHTNPSSSAIARSIIAMAHELDLKVVAEGIETLEQQNMLLEAGCDFGQGFLFSKPMPFNALIAMVH